MLRLSLTMALAGLALAVPVAAAIKVATYSGTILTGYDGTDEFGTGVTDLAGLRYVARYTYDTTRAFRQTAPGVYDETFGGDFLGTLAPILATTLTVNGVTLTFNAQERYGFVSIKAFGETRHESRASDYGAGQFNEIYNYGYPGIPLGSLDDDLAPQTATALAGGFNIYLTNPDSGAVARNASGSLRSDPDSFVSISGTVPEPASWALMIAGFGAVGGAARRRRAFAA